MFRLSKESYRYIIGMIVHYPSIMSRKLIKYTLYRLGFEIRRLPSAVVIPKGTNVSGKAFTEAVVIPKGLNETEKAFIEFMCKKTHRSYAETEAIFLGTIERFKFASAEYRELCVSLHELFRILYDDVDEEGLLDSYRFHALPHLFRMMSDSYSLYSEPIVRSLSEAIVGSLGQSVVRKLDKHPPVVIDYGCGLGYISYGIANLVRGSKVYLVDIETLKLEFAKFRFDKQRINSEIITVSKGNIYPKLPPHDICIATDVFEHLKRPMEAYKNIHESLHEGGILYALYGDTCKEMFHISWNLQELRDALTKDFKRIDVAGSKDSGYGIWMKMVR
jgi:SAM-dependent methyltransferase